MRALTVWQPWATLIAIDLKPYEFRGHKRCGTLIGERIAIHASVRKVDWREVDRLIKILDGPHWRTTGLRKGALTHLELIRSSPEFVVYGHVLCTAVLGEPTKNPEIDDQALRNDSARDEHANWAWPMLDVQQLIPPIPARGGQGFWNWNA